jgi:hypothetical protein
MNAPWLTPARLEAAGIGAFFRPRDLEPLQIPFAELQRLVAGGLVEKVGPGLYRLAAAEPSEFETLAMVTSAVPGAIVSLLSALVLHGIGTQAPHEVWLALDRKARKPARLPTRVHIVRFSGPALNYRGRNAGVNEIMRAAEVLRARTVISPYLEALSA